MSTIAKQINQWADKLRDLTALGLLYTKDVYDRRRYESIQQVAMEMISLATDTSMVEMTPLRLPVFSRPTPLSTGDAAIFDNANCLLLIRRADNGLWAMPGGALEVGETAAEGVCREAFEETGIRCQAVALAGVFDSRLCGTRSRHHLYHFVFTCRPLPNQKLNQSKPNEEVLEARWFDPHELPPASSIDPGYASRIPQVIEVWLQTAQPYFDP